MYQGLSSRQETDAGFPVAKDIIVVHLHLPGYQNTMATVVIHTVAAQTHLITQNGIKSNSVPIEYSISS